MPHRTLFFVWQKEGFGEKAKGDEGRAFHRADEAREIHPLTKVAIVKEPLCQGCGACLVACPNKASPLRNFTPTQVMAMIGALV